MLPLLCNTNYYPDTPRRRLLHAYRDTQSRIIARLGHRPPLVEALLGPGAMRVCELSDSCLYILLCS